MFALMELYGADISDIVMNHEEDEKSSSVSFTDYESAA